MQIQKIYQKFLLSNKVVIDSRKVQKNDFFVALKGENFDANTFAKQAIESQAAFVLIDNPNYYIDHRTIIVEDCLKTLQELANYHRIQLHIPIIAITGTNGKTTTKELINATLSEKYNVRATVGNLNNHIGVPLTLLSFDSKTEIGIVEMGANHKNEIDFLCKIAEPNFGCITNFGEAHLDGFGSFEGVIQTKTELFDYIRNTNHNFQKKVFINLDDPIQVEKSKELSRFTFSNKNTNANVFVAFLEANPFVKINFEQTQIQSNLIGTYNVSNIATAITFGKYFEIETQKIKHAIENYFPNNNRSQIIPQNSNTIILDAYNANPSSMKVAIESFISLKQTKKMMILGDMFELGNQSLYQHKKIVLDLESQTDIEVFFVGNNFFSVKNTRKNRTFFESFDQLKTYFSDKKTANKTILIKGSRAMALERIIEVL